MSDLTRRRFLAYAGAGAGGLSLGTTTRVAFGDPADPSRGDVVVSVFLRGGADGLSLVVPFGDPDYARLRPGIAVAPPGRSAGALDLNGYFGLHPAMAALYGGLWTNGRLAVVHAVGLPDAESDTRSHFEAQAYWERASANLLVRDGWLARQLGAEGASSVVAGVGLRSSLPAALRGSGTAVAVRSIDGFRLDGFDRGEVAAVGAELGRMYQGVPGPLGLAARSALSATELIAAAGGDRFGVQNGAVYPASGLGRDLRSVAQLIRAGIGVRAACVDTGGWDMHEDMGTAANGQMASRAKDLADALAAFAADLGPALAEVTVLTMSEFGRTVRQNGSGGTDHGRGSALFVMGGSIRGGIYGRWPGLAPQDEDRDLEVTTDMRTVLAEVLQRRLDSPAVGAVLPGFAVPALLGLAD